MRLPTQSHKEDMTLEFPKRRLIEVESYLTILSADNTENPGGTEVAKSILGPARVTNCIRHAINGAYGS